MNNDNISATDTATSRTRRMPAEWEPSGAVLIAWPHADTDWAYMLDEVTRCYCDIARAITDSGSILIVVAPDISIPKNI